MIRKIQNNDMQDVLNSKTAVIDFSAQWCGPCKMLEPVLRELSGEMPEVEFFNADTDANMELAMKYGIQSIPALLLFKNGKESGRTVGFQPKESLRRFIENA